MTADWQADGRIEIGTSVTDISVNRMTGRTASGKEHADAITKS